MKVHSHSHLDTHWCSMQRCELEIWFGMFTGGGLLLLYGCHRGFSDVECSISSIALFSCSRAICKCFAQSSYIFYVQVSCNILADYGQAVKQNILFISFTKYNMSLYKSNTESYKYYNKLLC